MSFLVELPRETFPDDALDGLDVGATKFRLENAQAMMWMSQLAYETAHEGKVNDILKAWKLTRLAFGSNDPVTGLPPKSACFVVAEGHGATIVTFSGGALNTTEPSSVSAMTIPSICQCSQMAWE